MPYLTSNINNCRFECPCGYKSANYSSKKIMYKILKLHEKNCKMGNEKLEFQTYHRDTLVDTNNLQQETFVNGKKMKEHIKLSIY